MAVNRRFTLPGMAGQHRRRKRATTTDQYAAMLTRMMRGYGKRVAEDPAAALTHLRMIEAALSDATNQGIHRAIESGKSPTEIADVLGVSRQAIYKRATLGGHGTTSAAQPQVDTIRVARPQELPPGETGRP
jgi:hypothetical protein